MIANFAILAFLLLLNGFFSMAELAIVSSRKARLRQYEDRFPKGTPLALRLSEDPTAFLSIVQTGMTLNSVLAGAFGGATFAGPLASFLERFDLLRPYSEHLAFILTVVGVSYLNIVVGELLPKRIGLAHAEGIAVRVAPMMDFFARMTAPVVWLLSGSTEILFRMLGMRSKNGSGVTEEEVKDMIAEGTESGVFAPAEKNMLEGVLRLSDRTARTIMTPRIDMAWIDINDPVEENARYMRESGYSRFPVARGDMEEVLGVIHAKDLLNAALEGRALDIQALMRPPFIVPDTTPVLRLIDLFKQSGQHLAIVIDEYGSVEGLVTVTDIIEAVTGEMPEPGQKNEDDPVRREDVSWLVDGMTPIDEVEAFLGFKNMRDGDEYHTLAGFVIDKLGRIPAAADYVMWGGARFEVVDMDGRRVDKVLIQPPVGDEEGESDTDD